MARVSFSCGDIPAKIAERGHRHLDLRRDLIARDGTFLFVGLSDLDEDSHNPIFVV
jgi:hypothetical protein